jgi:hypothetical protein
MAGGINNAVMRCIRELGLKAKPDTAAPSLAEIAARHAKAESAPA